MKSASSVCIERYTFLMTVVVWLMLLGAIGGAGYMVWKWYGRWQERERASEERFASFVAQARPAETRLPAAPAAAPPAQASSMPLQKLLFEAAAKAGEAGEPVLSIQLYARLLARYPDSALGAQARAAVEAQKKRIATPTVPGTSGPG
jgi:hypothetical protein